MRRIPRFCDYVRFQKLNIQNATETLRDGRIEALRFSYSLGPRGHGALSWPLQGTEGVGGIVAAGVPLDSLSSASRRGGRESTWHSFILRR